MYLKTTLALICMLNYGCLPMSAEKDVVIWHDSEAKKVESGETSTDWLRAFPIGNGSLGGMVYGNVDKDEVQINHDTLYALEPDTAGYIPDAKSTLPTVRKLLANGKIKEAETLMRLNWLGRSNAPYMSIGSLHLDCHPDTIGVTNYRKSLDLSEAVVATTYTLDGVNYRREYFSSYPDKAIVMRLQADKPGKITTTLRFSTPHAQTTTFKADGTTILMHGQGPGEAFRRRLVDKVDCDGRKYPCFYKKGADGKYSIIDPSKGNIRYGEDVGGRGMFFAGLLRVSAEGGTVSVNDETLTVTGADSLTLVMCGDTSFNGVHKSPSKEGKDPVASVNKLQDAIGKIDYDTLQKRHVKDHKNLFNRLSIELGAYDSSKRDLPTDQRIIQYGKHHSDPSLSALLYQFSRYLSIASSRPGSQPAGLQGLWNKDVISPWNGAYTTNINAEMNYWNIERGNLSELHEPFLRSITECVENGKKVAKQMYGIEGWCMHHNISIWRSCAPVDGKPRASSWPMGAGWYLQHVWEQYEFTQDKKVLETHYPAMLESARFFSQWVEDRGDGTLWTPVGISPENIFRLPGTRGTLSVSPGPTMDMAIIRECYTNLLATSKIIGKNDPLLETIRKQLPKLLPYQIGKYGQLQEWSSDYEEAEKNHRHISHLYGFFPGSEINNSTPKLLKAVRKSMERRGNGATGWSMGWKLCIWARLGDPVQFGDLLGNLLHPERVASNLFALCPPFQIDGNFGAARGIAECLIQDHEKEIVLLPSLPKFWPEGSVNGIVVKGNHEIDFAWKNGKLTSATLRSRSGKACKIRYGDNVINITPEVGKETKINL